MEIEVIRSNENKFFKKLKKLTKKKHRDAEGIFIAEGHKFLDFEIIPQCIVINEGNTKYNEKIEKFKTRKVELSEEMFNQLTTQQNSQGILLVYNKLKENNEKLEDNIIVLDKVQDPGNLGTIIRVADAAGYKDIVLIKGSVDPYNDKCVRSSMGSIFNMNIITVSEEEIASFLKERKYKIIATSLEENSIDYKKMNVAEKNAFIFGNEGTGISKELLNAADECVIIPIYGSAESLNVAMACGIVLYKTRELLG